MRELLLYKKHAFSLLTAIKKPAVAVPAIGMLTLSDCQWGMFLLFGLMAFDFLTGVLASWNLWKDSKIESNFWKYGFSSLRIRESVVKSVTYFLLIMCAYWIETTFKIKTFKVESYSEHQITLTLFAIAVACAIEFYSIFFENLPKAGFSIESKVKLIFIKIKTAVKSVKNITNDDNSPS
ncbi:phage holin family protein [Chryseobacterium sp. PBS4-4]|uniref:Phage holin family protein n=1 Tax=Chryseobacterium edaphi TaxID=2976532 RepID=A0ABT2W094_9FLAO|nr:phage holin family protein [Chryseobacterium edaphi]MCU7615671.1 phage holin family protein [Chryseobacterium edaphi]